MKPHLPHTPKELQVAQLAELWPKQLPPDNTFFFFFENRLLTVHDYKSKT